MKKVLRSLIMTVIAVFMTAGVYAEDMLQVKGSDTLINLVQRLAEEYMAKNPDKYVAVTGGGSGTGVAALINKKCDIANSSRNMKDSEIEQAVARGVKPTRIVIAIDGLSIVTHPSNPVVQLTVDEIGKIFRGEITNWREVGGKDMPITLYGRQSNSGTYVYFRDEVLKGEYASTMNHMNGTAQIVEGLKNDPSGIGYVGVGYVKNASGVNVMKVAAKAGGTYADPRDMEEVNSGRYPISRPLQQYVDGIPEGKIRDFLAFELSEEGQKITEEEGFYPIPSDYAAYNKKAGL